MMTKKDYELIASVLERTGSGAASQGRWSGVCIVALRLADAFAADNPRFQRDRFLAACGLED